MVIGIVVLAAAVLLAPPGAHLARHRVSPPRASRCWWLAGVSVCALVGVGIGWAPTTLAITVMVGALIGVIRRRHRRRSAQTQADRAATAAALAAMSGHLRTGTHPALVIASVATEFSDGPTHHLLERASAAAQLGAPLGSAIRTSMPRELAAQWEAVADYCDISERHGVSMSSLLDLLAADYSVANRFRARMLAELAGPRATANVLAALPIVGIGLGEVMGARPIATLTGGGLGGVLAVLGVMLIGAGLLWSDAIIDRAQS